MKLRMKTQKTLKRTFWKTTKIRGLNVYAKKNNITTIILIRVDQFIMFSYQKNIFLHICHQLPFSRQEMTFKDPLDDNF